MELRYRPRARTTRDLDLTIATADPAQPLAARLERVRDELQAAAEADAGDFLRYTIAAAHTELRGAPLGGARFTAEATLAGRPYGRFHLDVGFGDAVLGEPERLGGDDLLAFAGVAPASVLALPRAQHFAEKVHAYTFPWVGRTNTRTKDLVDLVLYWSTAAACRRRPICGHRGRHVRTAEHTSRAAGPSAAAGREGVGLRRPRGRGAGGRRCSRRRVRPGRGLLADACVGRGVTASPQACEGVRRPTGVAGRATRNTTLDFHNFTGIQFNSTVVLVVIPISNV